MNIRFEISDIFANIGAGQDAGHRPHLNAHVHRAAGGRPVAAALPEAAHITGEGAARGCVEERGGCGVDFGLLGGAAARGRCSHRCPSKKTATRLVWSEVGRVSSRS